MNSFPGKRGPKSTSKGVVIASRGVPEPPSFLSADAREEWDRQAKRLITELGMTDADLGMLVAYCEAYGQLAESSRKIQEHGRFGVDRFGRSYQFPWATAVMKASSELRQLSERIGLSPGARAKLPVVADAAAPDPSLEAKRAALFGGAVPKARIRKL